MRWVAMVVGWAALAAAGCDRLPARGGQGEPCFDNGSCREGLICTGGTCKTEEPCQVEEDCPAGHFCDDGVCLPCEDAEHCGPGCDPCDADSAGLECVRDELEGPGEHRCGCNDDNDCPAERSCIVADMMCEGACLPDCDGKCGGADDDCGGTCDDPCPQGRCCVGQQCLEASDDKYCGVDCTDCTGRQSDRLCVALDGGFRCGCTPQAGCAAEEVCSDQRCQPRPEHVLDIQDGAVTALALSGIPAGEDHGALLLGCDSGYRERLWFLDGSLLPDAPDQQWDHLDAEPTSLQFERGSYSMMATDASGRWHYRQRDGQTWKSPVVQYGSIDGQLDGDSDGYTDGYADGAADGGQDETVGVGLARWSPAGDHILAAADYWGWFLFDGVFIESFEQKEWFASQDSVSALAFLAHDPIGVVGLNSADQDNLVAFGLVYPYERQSHFVDGAIAALATPPVESGAFELAGIVGSGGQTRVHIWTDVGDALGFKSEYDIEIDAVSLAFLPEPQDQPARYLLLGTAGGEIRAFKLVGDDNGLRQQALVVDCQGGGLQRMALSPDGQWLATACGNRVQLWSTVAMRTYLDR
jgi:hypothetical protein